jgi:hypothetical protein
MYLFLKNKRQFCFLHTFCFIYILKIDKGINPKLLILIVSIVKGKRPLGRQDIDGWIILKYVLEIQDGIWTGLIWLRTGASGGLL